MAYAPFLPSQMITRNWSRWDSDITRQSQVDSVVLSKNLPDGGFGRRLKFSPQCKPSSTSLRSSLPKLQLHANATVSHEFPCSYNVQAKQCEMRDQIKQQHEKKADLVWCFNWWPWSDCFHSTHTHTHTHTHVPINSVSRLFLAILKNYGSWTTARLFLGPAQEVVLTLRSGNPELQNYTLKKDSKLALVPL